MSTKLEKQKEQARSLEAKDPKGAIEAWLRILKLQLDEAEPNPDLSIYNRVGDLYLKVKDPAQAADYYDQAVDAYADLGFYNNAIAMCNKVLRNAPGRPTTYLKLAKLYAAKGFMAEAKQHFVEYAERMQRAGKIQQAFGALKEFTDISPESAHLREILAEHLRRYGDPERRASGLGAPASPAPPPEDVTKSGKRKTSSLVFLDVDAPAVPKGKQPGRVTPPPKRSPPPPPPPEPAPVRDSLLEPVTPEPDTSLEIESTTLVEGLEPTGATGMLEGLETTSADFGGVRLEAGDVPSVRDEPAARDLAPLPELEPTVPPEAPSAESAAEPSADLEPLLDHELEIEPPPRAAAPPPAATPARVTPVVPKRPATPGFAAPAGPSRPGVGAPPRVTFPKTSAPKFAAPGAGASPTKVKPVVPRRPTPPAPGTPSPHKRAVEVPPLELEPDFEAAEADAAPEVDDAPLATDEPRAAQPPRPFFQTEDDTSISEGRRSGFIDLGAADVAQGDEARSLVFGQIGGAAAKPTVEELEARVADDPDDPEAHQALGEALIEEGERDRGTEELDLATTGFENRGNLPQARDLVDEILRLDPNSVRHRQKKVEFAFKSGDKAKLIDAYVELADALLRSDLPDKARAVYQRVAEHDPGNERATAALAMLAPVVAPPAVEPPAKPKPRARDTEVKTQPKDAKMRVRDEVAAPEGDWVDLGAMILDEPLPERDTRMKVADEEPTGDEERDFQGMLARFKQGIAENIEEGDFQSHYDLGVAFKEMGLVDEAIAELQKALRAPEGKLKSSEALGVCFIDKRAYVVAESILRRALDLPAGGDQERLGILYWLGRALEAQGKKPEARDLYGRVFAVEIRFMDVGERIKALARAK
ncbi:MAG TPA: tetratricopeptide repeat protein [Gemmatimonadales bacterium]|nr:tetratricopeptide repeat protein [Gemmatimonadales bacterium]